MNGQTVLRIGTKLEEGIGRIHVCPMLFIMKVHVNPRPRTWAQRFTQANRRAHMRGTKFCNKVSGIMRQASLHYTQDMKGKNAHIRGAKVILPAL